jgi:hypothetical protein
LLNQPQEPVVWQDDEAIHQQVLERMVIKAPISDKVTPQAQQAASQRWNQLAQQHQKKTTPPTPPPPDPNSPEGQYQTFLQKITQQAVLKAEQIISQAIEQADLATAPVAAPTPPNVPAAPVPSAVPIPGQPGAPPVMSKPVLPRNPVAPHPRPPAQGRPPHKGAPQNPRTQPLANMNPSVAAAPVAMQGGPGVSARENATAAFERSAPQ